MQKKKKLGAAAGCRVRRAGREGRDETTWVCCLTGWSGRRSSPATTSTPGAPATPTPTTVRTRVSSSASYIILPAVSISNASAAAVRHSGPAGGHCFSVSLCRCAPSASSGLGWLKALRQICFFNSACNCIGKHRRAAQLLLPALLHVSIRASSINSHCIAPAPFTMAKLIPVRTRMVLS